MPITIQTPLVVQTHGKKGALVPFGLFDVLKLEKTAKRQISIIQEKGFRFPTNAQNQTYQIAAELHRHVHGKTGVKISIQKNIPPGKGLGSWASASVGTMLALNRLWDLRLSERRLLEIAKKLNPEVSKILKIHFGGLKIQKSAQGRWAIAAIPKLIEIDRNWALKLAIRQKITPEAVVESHFPDLRMIRESLARAGWKQVGISRLGPAIIGFSKKRIGIAKIPKTIRSKLNFSWIGKACDGQFNLLD